MINTNEIHMFFNCKNKCDANKLQICAKANCRLDSLYKNNTDKTDLNTNFYPNYLRERLT